MIVVTNFEKVGIFCTVCYYTYIAKIMICISTVPYVQVYPV